MIKSIIGMRLCYHVDDSKIIGSPTTHASISLDEQ